MTSSKPILLDCKFLSHGTIPCSDLQYTIRFLTEIFGFDHVQTSDNSASFRMEGDFCFSAIEVYDKPAGSIIADKCHHHFGIDVATEQDVMHAYNKIRPLMEDYGIKKITPPTHGHGTYYIYIVDQDSNYWEILVNPPDGYMYRFNDRDTNEDTRKWRDQENKNRDKQKVWTGASSNSYFTVVEESNPRFHMATGAGYEDFHPDKSKEKEAALARYKMMKGHNS